MTDRPMPGSRPAGAPPPTLPRIGGPIGPIGHSAAERRRRGLLAVAALAVLAAVAVVVPQAFDDDGGRAATPVPSTAPSEAGGSAANPAPGGQGGATGSAPAPSATRTGGASATRSPAQRTPTASAPPPAPAGVPAGFTRYRDPRDGWQVAVPTGWSPIRRDTRVDFNDPNSGRYLRIDTTDTPQADPYVNWIEYEQIYRQGKSNYENLGIRRVSYGADKGWTCADWEFRIGSTHVLNRNILVNSRRAHAIYWSTPESLWGTAESRRIFEVATATFVPAPVD